MRGCEGQRHQQRGGSHEHPSPYEPGPRRRQPGRKEGRHGEIDRQPLAEETQRFHRGPRYQRPEDQQQPRQNADAGKPGPRGDLDHRNRCRGHQQPAWQHPIPWRCCTHRTDGLDAHLYASREFRVPKERRSFAFRNQEMTSHRPSPPRSGAQPVRPPHGVVNRRIGVDHMVVAVESQNRQRCIHG